LKFVASMSSDMTVAEEGQVWWDVKVNYKSFLEIQASGNTQQQIAA